MLVNFRATMLHSLHHAFQHASVCDTLQGTWAAIRVAQVPLVSAIRKPADHIPASSPGMDHVTSLLAWGLVEVVGVPRCSRGPASTQRSVI